MPYEPNFRPFPDAHHEPIQAYADHDGLPPSQPEPEQPEPVTAEDLRRIFGL